MRLKRAASSLSYHRPRAGRTPNATEEPLHHARLQRGAASASVPSDMRAISCESGPPRLAAFLSRQALVTGSNSGQMTVDTSPSKVMILDTVACCTEHQSRRDCHKTPPDESRGHAPPPAAPTPRFRRLVVTCGETQRSCHSCRSTVTGQTSTVSVSNIGFCDAHCPGRLPTNDRRSPTSDATR